MKRFSQPLPRSIAKYALFLLPKNAISFKIPPLHRNLQIPPSSPISKTTTKRKSYPFYSTTYQDRNPFSEKAPPNIKRCPSPTPPFSTTNLPRLLYPRSPSKRAESTSVTPQPPSTTARTRTATPSSGPSSAAKMTPASQSSLQATRSDTT